MLSRTELSHRAIVRRGTLSSVVDRPTPTPAAGEVIIAPESVSLCGTDIQIVRGDRDDPSPIVGHEGAGRIVAVGDGVEDFAPGDRVIVNPTHPGDPSFLLGHNVDGLFQERVSIAASAVAGGLVSHLTADIDSRRATLIEPWAVVRYALACMADRRPDTLVVVGDGLIGNLAAYLAPRTMGETTRVIVLHRSRIGSEWTHSFVPGAVNRQLSDDWSTDAGHAVGLLVATHRGGTVAAMERATALLGNRLVAIHPIGGIAAGSTCTNLPGVDPAGVRAANTGGPWPPARVRYTSGAIDVTLTGNRGVDNRQLLTASVELAAEKPHVDSLLTHIADIDDGVEIMNALCHERRRAVDGHLVMRLVIDLNNADGTTHTYRRNSSTT